MRIKLLGIGKTTDKYLEEGIKTYTNRLTKYIAFEDKYLPEIKNAKNLSQSEIKNREGVLLLNEIKPTDHIILLDEKGKEFTSRDFAFFLQQKMNASTKQLLFIIGGAYGFSDEIYKRANGKIALSQLTFSHQMVRLFFTEQLYRAFTILNNEPYHHD